MAFALSIIRLEEALSSPGCAICRIGQDAAVRSLEQFLWEYSNDPGLGAKMRTSYGFCPQHTRMLAAVELANDGSLLAVNQVFSRLAKWTAADLARDASRWQPLRGLRRLFAWIGSGSRSRKQESFLPVTTTCPTCQAVEKSAHNTLATLFEELEKDMDSLAGQYTRSDGICLEHLRYGLNSYHDQFPRGANFLVRDTVGRLTQKSGHMLEYIRKQNLEYQDEALTEVEKTAWREVLTFFSGYPGERFTHHIDPY